MAARKTYILKLYVAGNTPNSMRALNTLREILENEDKREVMRKEARYEAEKWDWNQATLQLQNYYANTLEELD